MSRKLKSSLSVAVKGWSVERYQICGDQQHSLSRGRHGVLRVQDKPSNDFRIYRPTTTMGLQIKCRVISPGFLNAIIYSKDAREPGSSKRPFTTNAKRAHQLDGELDEQAGPTLLPEQQDVVNHAVAGHNVFFTGSAGCGKSTVLHEVRRRLEALGKMVHVVAPTGIVALAIGGTTIWSFAGWTPNSSRRSLRELRKTAKLHAVTRKWLLTADTLIIDEISMIENNFFERFDFLLRNVRSSPKQPAQPFGGIQIIVTGDFCQLPPVKPFEHCFSCGREIQTLREGIEEQPLTAKFCAPCRFLFREENKFAFSSTAWHHCKFKNIHLNTIHRQRDPTFISILQKCRLGIPFSTDDVAALTRPKPGVSPDNAVKIFPLRADVRQANEKAFQELQTPPITFTCGDYFGRNEDYSGPSEDYSGPSEDYFGRSEEDSLKYGKRLSDGTLKCLDDHRFERKLSLKKGMRVVLLSNLDVEAGLYNGSQGKVVGFEPLTFPTYLGQVRGEYATLREKLISDFASAHAEEMRRYGLGWPIVEFDNGHTETIYAECNVHAVGYEPPYWLACRTQIPLTAGYALTIHKAQGMTLEKVIVDLSKVFEERQIYVALSRVKALEGLQVVGLTSERGGWGDVEGAEKVRRFLRETFGDEVVTY
ncbi:Putative DNA repair and recombination protein [Podospora comata]|uniref:ATP-dependent DNA helicase n=1 Tax=Podospora comata TaxID=48703 RepID=A0ABY6SCS2_PODCO|nr:Putative DNA repair and recombination protein [Podospora comata]